MQFLSNSTFFKTIGQFFILRKSWAFVFLVLLFGKPVFSDQWIASIPPLQSLAAGLLKDVSEVDVILDGKVSAHTYSMKPSNIRKIRQARGVIWLGPSYETFLDKPLKSLGARQVKILDFPGLKKYPVRSGSDWNDTCHHHGHEHSHGEDCSHDDDDGMDVMDSHVWLDPENALVIAHGLKDLFLAEYPEKQEKILQNFHRVEEELKNLHSRLDQKLELVRNKPFLVFHDGYQYFEKAFRLSGAGVLVINPENAPSARHMERVIQNIRVKKVRCIFSETQFSPGLVTSLGKNHGMKVGSLDPLGHVFHRDEKDYIAMMETLADNFLDCFAESE